MHELFSNFFQIMSIRLYYTKKNKLGKKIISRVDQKEKSKKKKIKTKTLLFSN